MRRHLLRHKPFRLIGPDGETLYSVGFTALLADYRRRRVAETFLGHGRNRIRVSTILRAGLDHIPEEDLQRIGMDRFETKVFCGPLDESEASWPTRAVARIGHKATVFYLREVVQETEATHARRRRMHSSYRRRAFA